MGSLYRAENTRIASDRHVLNTVRTNKIALSSFDDKRYILDDGISTLPYGYIESSEPPSNNSRRGNNSSTFHADSANDETLDRDSDDDDNLDAWVAHFEDNDAPIEWDQGNILDGMSQELDRTQIDFYEILKNKSNIIDEFDFSNYPENHPLFNKQNKLTVLKYKDEFPADTITDFIALKPKLYSIVSLSEYFQLLIKIC